MTVDPPAPAPSADVGDVEVVQAPDRWVAGRPHPLVVRATNASDLVWRPDEATPVRVGVRFLRDGATVGAEGRIDLPGPIGPGGRELVTGTVVPPGEGRYRLLVDLVREHVAWFDRGVERDAEVEPERRIVVTGGFSPYRHLGDDLIIRAVLAALAEVAPDHHVVLLADVPAQASAAYGPPAVQGANPLLHRGARAGVATCLRRIASLRRDARRVRAGRPPRDPAHTPLLEALAGAHALVAPGAGWFTSKYRVEQVLPRLAEVEAARVLGVPVLFESGTVGPFDSRLDRLLARRMISGLASMTVRDGPRSSSVARSLGARHVAEVPDAATASAASSSEARDAWLAAHGVDPAGPYAVVSVRDTSDPTAVGDTEATRDTLVAALREVAEAGIPALFLPHCVVAYTDDRPAGRAVAERAPLIVTDDMPPDDVAVALIRDAAIAVGNRFHLALVADASGTPGLFLASTPFDDVRAGAFTGGNVQVVRAVRGGGTGPAAVRSALATGRGAPAPRWDARQFGDRLAAVLG